MTVSSPTPATATDRDPDLIVAHAHLRLGSLGLARAELETLAGRDRLDDEGIRDLAEARWRTGDTAGAGEAAAAYLEVDTDDVLALVIAAEAQVDLGRPAEARRLAGRALERADGSLDPIFAGMKRSSIWPAEAGTAVGPVGVLFDDLHPSPIAADGSLARRVGDRHPSAPAATHPPLDPDLPAEIDTGPGLWDDQPPAPFGPATSVDADALFHSARSALDRDDAATAATALLLAMRSSSQLAPAVLDLLSGRAEPILVLVRGDAQRIVGREAESIRDHAAAATRVVELSGAPGDTDLEVTVEDDAAAEPEPETEPTDPAAEPETERAAEPEPETEPTEPAAEPEPEPTEPAEPAAEPEPEPTEPAEPATEPAAEPDRVDRPSQEDT